MNKKTEDAENNNAQLSGVKSHLIQLGRACKDTHDSYVSKRNQVLQLRASGGSSRQAAAWPSPTANSWPVTDPATLVRSPAANANAAASVADDDDEFAVSPKPGQSRYRALYEFVARNGDEVSFQPGDVVLVTESLSNEPGWLTGEVRGHVGWFPESYVVKITDNHPADDSAATAAAAANNVRHALEGIQELPENVSDNGSLYADATSVSVSVSQQSSSAFISVASKGSDEAGSPILGQVTIFDDLSIIHLLIKK